MTSNEILKFFDTLMKRKNQRKLSGALERKAYKSEAQKLKEHLQFVQSYERRNDNE